MFKHSQRHHSLLQGHLEYVMHTELASPQVSISPIFLCRKRVLACSCSGLFNFRLLFDPENSLEKKKTTTKIQNLDRKK